MTPDPPGKPPRFSILTAVYNPPRAAFEDTVASVLGQEYTGWEWILVDDRSPDEWVRTRLADLAASDPRIRVHERATNGGIVAASRDALARATGEFVALLDHDDVLVTRALEVVAELADRTPELDFCYSDQDYMTMDGKVHSPYYKPDWSPERLRHHMYTSHFAVLRRSLVEEVGGFRDGYDGSQDHDLVLRVTEKARVIEHIHDVLYHWREVPGSAARNADAKPWAWDAGVRAVQSHLDRVGISATAEKGYAQGLYSVRRQPDTTTPVSIIMPTIGSSSMVRGEPRVMVLETVRSVLRNTHARDVELIIVYDTATPDHVLEELRGLPLGSVRLKMVEFTKPFNFSEKCNVGALHASGQILVFLNDDMEAYSEGVLEHLIVPLSEPDVGAVGPKLLFEGSRIQHAGVSYGSGSIAHLYYKVPHPAAFGYLGELWINREVSALTGACLAVRREVFEEVGGFTENLPVNFNDIDFCLKIRRSGLRLVWLHDVVLHHFESITRDNRVRLWEVDWICQRWGDFEEVVREAYTNGVT
ncbi:glycosyltransferase family 2 protein [Nocardioides dilutus]